MSSDLTRRLWESAAARKGAVYSAARSVALLIAYAGLIGLILGAGVGLGLSLFLTASIVPA